MADVSHFCSDSGFFTARELEITESTASAVVSKIASGEWTSVEVLSAVSKRAAVAQQLLNWYVVGPHISQISLRRREWLTNRLDSVTEVCCNSILFFMLKHPSHPFTFFFNRSTSKKD